MAVTDNLRQISKRIQTLSQLNRQLDKNDQIIYRNLQEWPGEGEEIDKLLKEAERKLKDLLLKVSIASAMSKEQQEARETASEKWQNLATLMLPENVAHIPEILSYIIDQTKPEYLEATFRKLKPEVLELIADISTKVSKG